MVVRPRGILAGAALAVLLAAACLSTVASAGKKPRSTAVGVSEREFRVAVYRATVPPGTVRFNLANNGEDVHDLVVRTAAGRTVARSGELRSGERLVLSTHLRAGTYRLNCEIADHTQRGMKATIRVVAPRKRGGR